MQLLIFRHGIAEDVGPDGDDASRRLTDEGIEKTRKAAQGLAKVAPSPDVILTSPLTRAAQTAAILAEAFGGEPRVMKSLAHGPVGSIVQDLRRRREATVMVVGHEPLLSRLIESLCTGNHPIDFVQMKKAGCALVDTPINDSGVARGGKLLWLATPKMLRAMA